MGLFDGPGVLRKLWNEAKSKVDKAVIHDLRFQEDLGPDLDDLEKSVKEVTKLRGKIVQTCASYKAKAEGKGLTGLVTTLDSIRSQVDSMVEELGKIATAKPV